MAARKRRFKQFKRGLVYLCLRGGVAAFCWVPLRFLLVFGRIFGPWVFVCFRRAHALALSQVRTRLQLPEAEAAVLVKKMAAHLGMTIIEIAYQARLKSQLTSYVKMDAVARACLQRVAAEHKGVVVVSAHLGNWELLAARLALEGLPAASLAKAVTNPGLGRWLIDMRRDCGVVTINRGDPQAPRQILLALRKGALLGALIDQDTQVRSVFVPFFGSPAKTPTVAAELAERAPVVVAYLRRQDSGWGHEVCLEAIDWASEGQAVSQSRSERIAQRTALLSQRLEAAIRQRPWEWVWFHERWKSRPES